jgi:Zn-dependent protease
LDRIFITVLVLLFSAVVHEVAHGWTALRLGDPTARDLGRLTFNPLRHIDPIGSILVPLMLAMAGGFFLAWARPVPVRPELLRDPVNDQPKVAAAGPLSNLLLAALFAVLAGLTVAWSGAEASAAGGARQLTGPVGTLFLVFQTGILANVWLAVFNLLPIPPLDGSWILARFLDAGARRTYLKLGRYGILLVLGFLVLLRSTDLGPVFVRGMFVAMEPFLWIFRAVAAMGQS